MKPALLLLALLVAVGPATADNATTPSNVYDPGTKVPGPGGSEPITSRTGGETIASATVIAGLPYSDVGTTCGFVNDYDEVCPYFGSMSPDVVYAFTPAMPLYVEIDLCDSYYDTKVYVYQDTYTPGAPYACNDDACSGSNYPYPYASMLTQLFLEAGHTYYIVIDGYGGDCGTYELSIWEMLIDGCFTSCPPGALIEGEPDCGDNYVDTYNGGCNSTPYVFQELCPSPGTNTAVLCGKSGTYNYFGWSYRDTDWFTVYGLGGTVTATLCADFPVQLILIYGTDCLDPEYDFIQGPLYEEVSLSHDLAEGALMWVWAGPSVFSGWPCGLEYMLTVENIGCQLPDAAEESSWGSVKNLFR